MMHVTAFLIRQALSDPTFLGQSTFSGGKPKSSLQLKTIGTAFSSMKALRSEPRLWHPHMAAFRDPGSALVLLIASSVLLVSLQSASFHDDDCELASDIPGTAVPR